MGLLKLKDVAKNFGAIEALKGVDLEIGPGEVVGLMGDNGAGKSTLVKIISGNFRQSRGSIEMDGELVDFHRPMDARDVGIEVVYQDLAIADNLTAAENVFLGREIRKGWGPFKILDKKPPGAWQEIEVAWLAVVERQMGKNTENAQVALNREQRPGRAGFQSGRRGVADLHRGHGLGGNVAPRFARE